MQILSLPKFELLILNQIYNTSYFTPESFSSQSDYFSYLTEFITYKSPKAQNPRSNALINQIISLANLISNPQNFSCYDKIFQLNNLLETQSSFSKYLQDFDHENCTYSVLDVIVFSSLYNCKLWSKLYHPISKKTKETKYNPLERIFLWFQSFEETFTDLIKYRFNPSLLQPKHQKQQERLSKLKKKNPEFLNAIKDQHYEKVLDYLKKGVDLKVVDEEYGNSAGHIACLNGDLSMCKLLDEYGIDWESENLENVTPIFQAIESKNLELIAYLYSKKVNFEHLDFQNRTPFYHACCFGDLSVISYLYTVCHCNPNAKSHKHRTALTKACFLCKHEVVQYLLSIPPKDFLSLDSFDDKGRTALHNAAWGPAGGKEGKYLNGKLINDSPESAQILLEKGATVDFADFDGNTPFIIASASEGVATMKVLFNFGADVNKRNKKGETALHLACRFGHFKSIKLLVEEMKAKLLIKDLEGMGNLACCLMNNQKEIFNYLKEKEYQLKKEEDYQMDFTYILKNRKEKLIYCLEALICFLNEKKIEIKFLEEYLTILASFENKELFILVFKFFQSQMTIYHKQDLFYMIVEKNKLNFFKTFIELDPIFYINFNPEYNLLISLAKTKTISSEFLENLLFFTNFNFLHNNNSEDFLHFLIDSRNFGLLITLRDFFSSSSLKKITNKFLLDLVSLPNEEKELQIIEFLLRRNQKTEMNCFEYAKFKKFFDIEKVLKDFSKIFLKNSDIMLENYHIPYKIIEELPKELIYEHSKKPFLEETNQLLSEKMQFPKQYLLKNIEETVFFEKILNTSFNKKNEFTYIKTEENLRKLSQDLKKFSIFGIDLEYLVTTPNESITLEGQNLTENQLSSNKHSGIVCTLQISTIENDYIIDAIYLREQIAVYLKEIFEDFNRIKIFHGCDYDLQWLKVDFGIETMNIFDTARGHMILNSDKNSISLAKLSKHYLNIELDKSFQKSFWGMRPLPKVMLDYARLDSGILLGLFPWVLKELKEKNTVLQMALCCNRICWEKVERIKMGKTNFLVLE